MRSTFYGFEIAKTGLFASQLNIDLTAHNIANANTIGYTRQRLNVSSKELISGAVQFREVTRGYSGAGVNINNIEQVRSTFLDAQFRRENSALQQWSTRADGLGYIETLLSNTGKGSLSGSIDTFFSSLHKLTESPESKEYRTNTLQNALQLTDTFNKIYTQLTDKLSDQNTAVKTVSDQINDLARNLAAMNEQIYRSELSGDTAVDLRDQRNLLLDNLSSLGNISYSEGSDGKMTVLLGGHTLVNHISYNQIVTTQDVTNPTTGNPDFYSVRWSDDNSAVAVTTGSLKGYLDLRDNDTANNLGIPYLIDRLNTLASGIATQFNAIQNAGYTLPDGATASVLGSDFFVSSTGAAITAGNLSVSAAIQANVNLIAASDVEITDSTLRGNNKNALKMVQLQSDQNLPTLGSIDGYVKGYLAEIGVEVSHTETMRDGELTMVESIETQRQSLSGVSVDEETTNLIKFQHAYAANARVITTIDEYLDVLINRMGVVGR